MTFNNIFRFALEKFLSFGHTILKRVISGIVVFILDKCLQNLCTSIAVIDFNFYLMISCMFLTKANVSFSSGKVSIAVITPSCDEDKFSSKCDTLSISSIPELAANNSLTNSSKTLKQQQQ